MKLYDLFSECIGIQYHEVGDHASYAVRRADDTLYIFFEGSNGARDWRRNFNFPVKPYRRMGRTVWFAHRGFLEAWRDIEPTLAVHIANERVKRLVVCGYSHGAAIALLCHEYVWYNRPELRNTLEGYGFGCPRVIWGRLGADVKRRWERFTVIRNIDDIVTHLPPAFLGYVHVGQLKEIGKAGRYSKVDAHRAENILTELSAYEAEPRDTATLAGVHIRFGGRA